MADSPVLDYNRFVADSPVLDYNRFVADSPVLDYNRFVADSPVLDYNRFVADSPVLDYNRFVADSPVLDYNLKSIKQHGRQPRDRDSSACCYRESSDLKASNNIGILLLAVTGNLQT